MSEYWNFSFSNSFSYDYSGLISFVTDWFDLLAVQGTLKSSPAPQKVYKKKFLLKKKQLTKI